VEIPQFFDGMELVSPGLTDVAGWRADPLPGLPSGPSSLAAWEERCERPSPTDRWQAEAVELLIAVKLDPDSRLP
jgi:hypothetical protein